MKIDIDDEFFDLLGDIVRFIAKDKPLAARKFKKDLISAVRKDLKFPDNYKKSLYFKDDAYRDYVFKGYTISYQIFENNKTVRVFGIIKNKYSY
ncbi:type II toxin-antitoxin system RelE/ParE family toxin [Flavobacterium nackdongense]|uniref:Type II toxin-antitoxin system RelE/ParE family toxin n=1 Tax=Flavobacterium nackdongense TaxID=2547394 RepID=A0A4P6YDP6_9FLAO|nr:type II toxin-antitoxin system RelE/ParE family toxin [Flavobacterium nackdongense]QBN18895.1 type II toxin-antitoxin system RelE/ParE family toxin [Flavobacterium nackdongense]